MELQTLLTLIRRDQRRTVLNRAVPYGAIPQVLHCSRTVVFDATAILDAVDGASMTVQDLPA